MLLRLDALCNVCVGHAWDRYPRRLPSFLLHPLIYSGVLISVTIRVRFRVIPLTFIDVLYLGVCAHDHACQSQEA